MTTPPISDLSALREVAEKATPGEWFVWEGELCYRDNRGMLQRLKPSAGNAIFIAAFNPQVVIALLDHLAAEKARADAAEAKLTTNEPPLTCPHIDAIVAMNVLPTEAVRELHAIRDINSQLRYGTWALKATISTLTEQLAEARGASQAISDVSAERQRQVMAEGWTPAHDDQHTDYSLAKAGCIYAVGATLDGPDRAVMDTHGASGTPGWMKDLWPWGTKWWKPTSRRRDLVKAAALIVAEIERLDRATLSRLEKQEGDGRG